MNNMYLIPANSNKGKLIFNIFRPVDLVVFITGLLVSIILFLAISSVSLITTIIKILPLGICTLLVVPVAFYHNVMCLLKDIYLFLSNRRVYFWRGWCVRSEFNEQK